MDKLTKEQIKERTDELAEKYNCEILPIEIIDPNTDEQLMAYVKAPQDIELLQKAIDLFSSDRISEARQIIFEIGLLREESHQRFQSKSPKDIKVVLGAHIACTELVGFYVNQFKKK